MVVAPVRAVVAIAGRDIGLAAEDQLDVVRLRLGVEVDRPEHVAVVGDRDGVHPELADLREQVFDADRPVEQAVLRVKMEMTERARGHDMTHQI